MGCCCGNNSSKTVTLNVEGMSCNHCKMAVEKSLTEAGVDKIEVDLEGKKVTATFNPDKLKEDAVKKAITDAGYEVIE